MATDLTIQKSVRHNHIGMIAINPSAIVSDYDLNNDLAIVTDLPVMELSVSFAIDANTIGSLSKLIPTSTLAFLDF